MPTTTSPWASPSSPAGRRLLLTEPATLDAVPAVAAVLPAPATGAAGPIPSPPPPVVDPTGTSRRCVDRRMSMRWGFAGRRASIRWGFAVRGPAVASPGGVVAPTPSPTRPAADRRAARSVALGAAVVCLLALAGPAGPRSAPEAAPPGHRSIVAPVELAEAMGQAVAAAPTPVVGRGPADRPPAAGGDVVVALVQPTETLRATPVASRPSSALAARLGAAVVRAAR